MLKAQQLGAAEEEYSLLFRAVIHAQLGQFADAREWYDRAAKWLVDHNQEDETNLALKAEVAALLENAAPSEHPTVDSEPQSRP
ncbi:MAG: hypothetical protein R3C10_23645 [Pirellulales bacterium]